MPCWARLTGLRVRTQGARLAGADAVAAEGAFAAREVDRRKTAITRNDDVFGAGAEAVVAARCSSR